ncbi:MAG: hypothetical protein ABJL99_15545 [Aliishimia sp.]
MCNDGSGEPPSKRQRIEGTFDEGGDEVSIFDALQDYTINTLQLPPLPFVAPTPTPQLQPRPEPFDFGGPLFPVSPPQNPFTLFEAGFHPQQNPFADVLLSDTELHELLGPVDATQNWNDFQPLQDPEPSGDMTVANALLGGQPASTSTLSDPVLGGEIWDDLLDGSPFTILDFPSLTSPVPQPVQMAAGQPSPPLQDDGLLLNTPLVQTSPAVYVPVLDVSNVTKPLPFKSSFADRVIQNAEEVNAAWRENSSQFYNKAHALLEAARAGDATAHNALADLIALFHQDKKFQSYIKNSCVRTTSEKRDGMAVSTGEDEFFKTSETMTWIEWSFVQQPGKEMVSKINGQDVDWMDAQENIRLSTDLIFWEKGLVGGAGGHTATAHLGRAGVPATLGQGPMHKMRDALIKSRSSPANAIMSSISAHLRITEKVFTDEVFTGEDAEQLFLSNGHTLPEDIEHVREDALRIRNKLKDYAAELERNLAPNEPGSPIRSGAPMSPRGIGSPLPPAEPGTGLNDGLVSGAQSDWTGHGTSRPIPSKKGPVEESVGQLPKELKNKIMNRFRYVRGKLKTPEEKAAYKLKREEKIQEAIEHVAKSVTGLLGQLNILGNTQLNDNVDLDT